MDPDSGFLNLESLIQKTDSIGDLSEADTRCKIIDRLLIDCLGYDEDAIQREPSVDSGYIDYLVRVNGIPFLVLEAKRVGLTFEIPLSLNRRVYKISGALSSNTNLLDAMRQVRQYCVDVGVKYAMVSNGFQYVVFVAFSPGRKWLEGDCIVYNGLEDIKKHFSQFWNTFSFEALKNGSFLNVVEERKTSLTFRKLSTELHNPDQKWERNRIYTYLADIVDFVFTELLDSTKLDVLKKCYIHERTNEDLGSDLDLLFVDKMPYFSKNYGIQSVIETEAKAGTFERTIRDLRKGEKDLPMVVLLGGIGSGKSTFIHRFFRVIMETRESLFWYYLDFRYSSFQADRVEEFIYEQIVDQFRNNYFDKIADKLREIGFSLDETNRADFVKRVFAVQKMLRISPILIIDNVDQHDYDFQEKLFIFSNHLCRSLNILTILALREETFIKSTRTGVFAAYHVSKFHIASPNFINMVRARIAFSIELLHNNEYLTIKGLEPEIVCELVHFFEILLRSFNKDNEQSTNIVYFFYSISVGNMREALRMFNSFLISGNTNIDDMFAKESTDPEDTFQIAFHQLLKSIILGEYRFYNSTRSHIANVLDFDTGLSDSHFNQLRVLRYLKTMANSESPIGRGYISIDDLLAKAESVMILKRVVLDSVLRLLKFNLVALDNQSTENLTGASYLTITASGTYYIAKLFRQFIYLSSVLIDTPIADTELIKSIRYSLSQFDLQNRVLITRNFLRYLRDAENAEFARNPQYLQSGYTNTPFMDSCCEYFNGFVNFLVRTGRVQESVELLA